jgi:hypothetical protein
MQRLMYNETTSILNFMKIRSAVRELMREHVVRRTTGTISAERQYRHIAKDGSIRCSSFALKRKEYLLIVENYIPTTKGTQHLSTAKINWLMLFKEIIIVYSENHPKTAKKLFWHNARLLIMYVLRLSRRMNTTKSFRAISRVNVTDCLNRWFILLPLDFEGLNTIRYPREDMDTPKLEKFQRVKNSFRSER